MNPPPAKPSRVVIEDHSWRNTFIAVGASIIVLAEVKKSLHIQTGDAPEGDPARA